MTVSVYSSAYSMCSLHILVANISSGDLLVACRQLKWRCRLTGWTEHISAARDAMSELLCSTSKSIVCQVLYAQYQIYRATGSTDFAATISSACKTVFPRDAMLMPLLVMPHACPWLQSACVRPSVCHKSEFYRNEWTDRADSGLA